MVNILTIAIVHAVLFLAAFRLMLRDDLDADVAHEGDSDEQDEAPQAANTLTASERRRARLRESAK
ncbi:MAG: hypothetical protein AAGK17_11710 [Pseudomonadota bacterium]